ncbi:sugar transferase [Garciella nitratireducens]|uniref:sugar transferase n=1 Tax=Garciella nitratireducens TaxID=218205 RepID=UPI000DEAB52A|nr:sugar transferase [Garciella nitratireducens]RBP37822.1 exopolysaccharide biosynthesis polyprenyl glycosylphosphotransferase [Garciella nitratireducens]
MSRESDIKESVLNIKKFYIKQEQDSRIAYNVVKRLIDIFLSLLGVVIGVPFIIIFGILIKLESSGPIIYTQERVGKDGKVFNIYKLRSMRKDAEKNGAQWAKKDDPRVTRVGKFIRLTRIDEIPQLFNILKGDMSIVGPRPERPNFTLEFNKEIPGFINRTIVKPGLTGWAQVNGGYDMSPREKLQYDLEYIRNQSLWLDIKIIFKTFKVVLTGEGAR